MRKLLDMFYYYKKVILIGTVIACVFIISLVVIFTVNSKEVMDNVNDELAYNDEINEVSSIENYANKVCVDIKGAVNNPGVYEVDEGKKVIDAIELAGGFTSNANTEYINLSKTVFDEMVITIYTNEYIESSLKKQVVTEYVEVPCVCQKVENDSCIKEEEEISGKININTASLEELTQLDGIGQSKAQDIINYRNEIGLFKSIEDLLNVSGIGQTVYDKIKESITT